MNEIIILIFQLAVFLFSVMVHEVSHGVVAHKLGDDTAKESGRLTLNPLKHLDPFGSIILPLMLSIPALFGQPAFIFGWAKPVPYNPLRLKIKNKDLGGALIAVAGPLTNFVLAVIFGLIIRAAVYAGVGDGLWPAILFFNMIVFINVLLGVFNLVPIPPLDGSKLLFWLIPNRYSKLEFLLERYGLAILLFFIFFGFQLIIPIINLIYSLMVGQGGIL